ncbi:hypothetical protein [Nocardiopsis sp. Huas11]|uniref:hypothetical protein n=1 Tax=Nocardiopsis sp. Huas11 TaxID=2183912 RepID=UPI000EAD74AC|nr:hypothetical protein [Nocardiopsis sp. Huas11]
MDHRAPPRSGRYPPHEQTSAPQEREDFDELASAYTWWQEAGRPEHSRCGVTIAPEGQRVWLDEPGNGLATTEPGTELSGGRSG